MNERRIGPLDWGAGLSAVLAFIGALMPWATFRFFVEVSIASTETDDGKLDAALAVVLLALVAGSAAGDRRWVRIANGSQPRSAALREVA